MRSGDKTSIANDRGWSEKLGVRSTLLQSKECSEQSFKLALYRALSLKEKLSLGMEQMVIVMFADSLEMFVGYVSSCCNIHQVTNYLYPFS